MLRTLLAERFKLVLHREHPERPIYALVFARSDKRLGRRTVVDRTGLTGRYDIDLNWTPDQAIQRTLTGAPPLRELIPTGHRSSLRYKNSSV
jgi:hypothetical protein